MFILVLGGLNQFPVSHKGVHETSRSSMAPIVNVSRRCRDSRSSMAPIVNVSRRCWDSRSNMAPIV